MEEKFYNPQTEAEEKGIKVQLINFKEINSFLTKSVIYLRKNMNKIEKRCTLAYELVHHSRTHADTHNFCTGHTLEEDESIRREAAQKLVCTTRLYELIESCYSIDKIANELEVTKSVLNDYFKSCKYKPAAELSTIK